MISVFAIPAVFAQDSDSPAAAAESVRQTLFDAQSALLSGDPIAAGDSVQAAHDEYNASLRDAMLDINPDIASVLDSQFETASIAARGDDSLGLAVARGRIWSYLLQGSMSAVFDAIRSNDVARAQSWLALREYRVSTRFSRPGADATLALRRLAAGEITPDEALTAVRIDLYDTYQAQLNQALADADEANARDFSLRRAEEAARAMGYFELIYPSYIEQRPDDADAAYSAFVTLVDATFSQDDDVFAAARVDVDKVLSGFRAAPLSDEEAKRRAGQLMRFLSLVPVEYGRGVHDGQVTSDIEIQEALTFHEGATAAFQDVQSLLMARDADATARIAAQLADLETQIRATADPGALTQAANDLTALLTNTMPAEWQAMNNDSDVDVILSVLDQVESAVDQGQYAAAESARLEAYAMLEFGIEQRLRGFAPDQATRIEGLFWQGSADYQGLATLVGTSAPLSEVKPTLDELRAALNDAQAFLSSTHSAPEAVAGNAAIIVFREGLEAVLILASLLASLRTFEERKFRRPMVIGALLALGASAVTWWLANQVLLSLMGFGERLEAVVSLIAIGVLLLITNWFFHKVYWTEWMAGFHARKRRLLGGVAVVAISQTAGLVLLGFTSIYREGFETVLFLQSLVLEAGMGVVLRGVALGLVGVTLVGIVTFALQVRLPYKKMLVVTGLFIGLVLLTMVGNTVHVMQAVGWLPITPIAGLQIPFWMGQWFGLFATWQGIGLQAIAAAFVIGSYYLAEYQSKSRRQHAHGAQPAAAVGD